MGFTKNKKFAAIVERRDAKDYIGVYYAGNEWSMVNQIQASTFDLQDIKWINGDSAILAWDSCLDSNILIYSAASGDLLTKFEPHSIGLGIKHLAVSPTDSMIAAGLFDTGVILYNNLTAQEIACLQHVSSIDLSQKSSKQLFVYQEEITKDKMAPGFANH